MHGRCRGLVEEMLQKSAAIPIGLYVNAPLIDDRCLNGIRKVRLHQDAAEGFARVVVAQELEQVYIETNPSV